MPPRRSSSATVAPPDEGASRVPSSPSKANGASSRAQSVAALILRAAKSTTQVFQVPCSPVVKVSVEGCLDIRVQVSVPGSKCEAALPNLCRAGRMSTGLYVSTSAFRGPMSKGTLTLEGFDAIPFSVAHNDQGQTFVYAKGKWRHTALSAPSWNWREHDEKPTQGRAADIEVVGSRSDKPPLLKVQVRLATEMELKRCLQLQALRESQAGEDYDTLHAQVAKAKIAGVEREHIEAAEDRLRDLRKMRLHISEGCDKDSLRHLMVWDKISRMPDAEDSNEKCQASPDCPCNVDENCGEVLQIISCAVQDCLKDFGPEGDRELFEELSASALAVEEGSVWRAGGKLIFSAFDRNQSVSALTRMLNNHGRNRCARMLLQMVKHSESEYGGYVTAIQINFHPHGGTHHQQHRDIYSAKQRAGPNCTCSFRKCVGTVCYSIGSSRLCLLETMTDELSAIHPCSAQCTSRRERRWIHSGDAMYFNEAWNANHTHGIPAMENGGENHGPRISIAFLLGAEETRINLYQLPNQVP